VFFHDILNSASALRGLAEVMERAPMEDKNEVARDIAAVCDRLIDEIKSQKELSAAENNQLSVEHSLISSRPFLEELVHFYQNHDVCRSRQLYLDPDVCQTLLISDRTLLWRVLSNMVKNALEACVPGETVTLGCRLHNRHVEFWVHNPDVISETVRLQIFQRSFSTKGPGRGLGTYSIKLLGERYLRGRVSFTSSASRGTTFKIVLPLQ
jgi:signal transduction histidine kinase